MDNSYKWGIDLCEDIKRLYGSNYEEINNIRLKLFCELSDEIIKIRLLNSIVQNPIPVYIDELKEWEDRRDKIEKSVKDTLDSMEQFVKKYHCK